MWSSASFTLAGHVIFHSRPTKNKNIQDPQTNEDTPKYFQKDKPDFSDFKINLICVKPTLPLA